MQEKIIKAAFAFILTAIAVLLVQFHSISYLNAQDRIYKWTDKSGQDNFTDDIDAVPEPWKSKFQKEDAKKGIKKKKPQSQSPDTSPASKTVNRSDDDDDDDQARPDKRITIVDDELEARKAKGKITSEITSQINTLKALLQKKTEEMQNAAKWEMMLQTPKYKQEKLKLMDEIDQINKNLKDYEKKLDAASNSRLP